MKFPVLFRRCQWVLPTLSGWLVILAVLGLVCVFGARNAAAFLAIDEPVGGDYLVIEGWLAKDELDQALHYFGSDGYAFVITVGGPIQSDFHGIDKNYAERAADYLVKQGLPGEKLAAVIAAPYTPRGRTFLNATVTRDWFASNGIALERLDVFTSDVHARRSRYLYELAFAGEVDVGVIPSQPNWFELDDWWRSSDSGKRVALELVGWAVDRCCFFPGE